jgi:hypothetical protein
MRDRKKCLECKYDGAAIGKICSNRSFVECKYHVSFDGSWDLFVPKVAPKVQVFKEGEMVQVVSCGYGCFEHVGIVGELVNVGTNHFNVRLPNGEVCEASDIKYAEKKPIKVEPVKPLPASLYPSSIMNKCRICKFFGTDDYMARWPHALYGCSNPKCTEGQNFAEHDDPVKKPDAGNKPPIYGENCSCVDECNHFKSLHEAVTRLQKQLETEHKQYMMQLAINDALKLKLRDVEELKLKLRNALERIGIY